MKELEQKLQNYDTAFALSKEYRDSLDYIKM